MDARDRIPFFFIILAYFIYESGSDLAMLTYDEIRICPRENLWKSYLCFIPSEVTLPASHAMPCHAILVSLVSECTCCLAERRPCPVVPRLCSVAPMMEWTDNHYRQLARLLSRHTWLYTEMVVDQTILHQQEKLVRISLPDLHPLGR